jgi:hydroxyethylthiazole kinase
MFEQMWMNVSTKAPLVHNITNYVTVNDCANIILACGASPIMADDIREVEEITTICNSLVINIGTLNERTIESMVLAGKKANELSHPVILDPVGVGASKLRTDTATQLLKEIKFSVIRGNISEIKTLSKGTGNTKGVDADFTERLTDSNQQEVIAFAKDLSKRTGAVIVITGATDLVADENEAYLIRNGHPIMSKITGSGCMLTAVIGAVCAANPTNLLEAAVTGVTIMGISGELAYEKMIKDQAGTSSFKMYLIDAISIMDTEKLMSRAKINGNTLK